MNQDLLYSVLQTTLSRFTGDASVKIKTVKSLSLTNDSDPFNENVRKEKYATDQKGQILGLHPYHILFEQNQREHSLNLMLKGYSQSGVDAELLPSVLKQCQISLSKPISSYLWGKEFGPSAWREINFYRMQHDYPLLKQYTPIYYGHHENEANTNIILIEEYITDAILLNEVADLSDWDENIILTAITGIAAIHSCSYENRRLLDHEHWKWTRNHLADMMNSAELWIALANFIRQSYPDLISDEDHRYHLDIIHTIPNWYDALLKQPVALIQNDFNPRNICFRKYDDGLHLCAYDWERTEINVPQHDLAEFLMFTLSEPISDQQILAFIEHHRSRLEHDSSILIDKKQWQNGFAFSLRDLHLNRLPFLLMFNHVFPSQFALRLFPNLKRLLRLIQPV